MKSNSTPQDLTVFPELFNEPARKAAAYPLITHDPYFSIWSFTDEINSAPTKHWSGRDHNLLGILKVDGVPYVVMGGVPYQEHSPLKLATQISVKISATQTVYILTCGGIDVELKFTSPLLMNDLDLMSRPVSYITVKLKSVDGEIHDVQLYFGASANIAVDEIHQVTTAESAATSKISFLKAGTVDQPILEKSGDDLRIDWGQVYLAASIEANTTQWVSSVEDAINCFCTGSHSNSISSGENIMLSTIFPKEKIATEKEHLILLGYDDIYSINYFETNLRPWWNKDGNNSIENELDKALDQYDIIMEKCRKFDADLHKTAEIHGGKTYAKLLDLGYRQAITAHKLVESPEGEILFLSKENYSNGSINTVDVTYPSAPLFLLYNPELLKGMMNGIFYYSESGKWTKPFPAHDLGTYPIATGQTYHEDMPVEEAGNMLILTAAIVKAEGNNLYAKNHWQSLSTWVEYLVTEGLDPEKQLCTDDFAGHLARNANLSIKAIVAVGCYASLAEKLGYNEIAVKYETLAKSMVASWMELADAGDHYALTFNDKNTWSQKYNLVWDRLLDLKLFPEEVYQKELSYYKARCNKYGLPLDSRSDYTKSDWILWVATLTDSMEDFKFFSDPVYAFAIETEDRVPLTDWHYTSRGKMEGFQARSVVGGFFIKFLHEEWKKRELKNAELNEVLVQEII